MGRKKDERKAAKLAAQLGSLPGGALVSDTGGHGYLIDAGSTWVHPRLVQSAVLAHEWGRDETLERIASLVAAWGLLVGMPEVEVVALIDRKLAASRRDIERAGKTMREVKTELLRVIDQVHAAVSEAERLSR